MTENDDVSVDRNPTDLRTFRDYLGVTECPTLSETDDAATGTP
ncbi:MULTISPECIES: hypothetical protein [unclassified Haladaptatus]|nr:MULTISPECIES: hypothetical protein [unclassified Haladaptatus]